MQRTPALETVFVPISSPSAFEETVERLGTAIRVGLLTAGHRLPAERDLAAQLGISRSTLRVAITTLIQSGHLRAVRGRGGGTFVVDDPPMAGNAEWLEHEARGVLDLRVAIETGATLLASERARPADLKPLKELVERMEASPTFEYYRRADVLFHIGVAEATHSPRLVAAMTDVQARMSELIARIPHPEQVLSRANSQHERIVHHLGAGDAGRAVRMMREHTEGTEHILAGLLP